jgi:hypothetical protein
MPHDVGNWDMDFLNYDYIGAPWGNCDESVAVGNGGFSLRSRKLMEVLVHLKLKCDPTLPDADAEDVVICKYHRQDILTKGCKFAPFALAQKFSTENSELTDTFGFHGVFNFPKFCNQDELIDCADEICDRTTRELFVINLLIRCIQRGMTDLYFQLIQALKSKGRYASIETYLKSVGALHLTRVPTTLGHT